VALPRDHDEPAHDRGGLGGNAQGGETSLFVTGGVLSADLVTLSAASEGGEGGLGTIGEGFEGPGGSGGNALAGSETSARLLIDSTGLAADVSLGSLDLIATSTGGFVSGIDAVEGDAIGGGAGIQFLDGPLASNLDITNGVIIDASGIGQSATGGNAFITMSRGAVTAGGPVEILANADAFGGGNALGGTSLVDAGAGAFSVLPGFLFLLDANARTEEGGIATAGSASLLASQAGGTVSLPVEVEINAVAIGGTTIGGLAEVVAGAPGSSITISGPVSVNAFAIIGEEDFTGAPATGGAARILANDGTVNLDSPDIFVDAGAIAGPGINGGLATGGSIDILAGGDGQINQPLGGIFLDASAIGGFSFDFN